MAEVIESIIDSNTIVQDDQPIMSSAQAEPLSAVLAGDVDESLEDAEQSPATTILPALDFAHGPLSTFGILALPDLTTEEFPWTDEGNARAIKTLFGAYFRYVEVWGWLVFTGTHWTTENAELLLKHAVV